MRTTIGFSLEIRLGNAAMRTPEDVADALRRTADRLEGAQECLRAEIRDLNGNVVGSWSYVPDEED